MTKDLSKQLCECAGIEAKTFKECQRGERFMGECPLSYCTSLGCSLKEYKLYPNFEIPENFVKLLECYFETVDGVVNYHKREEFITYIIEIAKDNNKLKQALQATEWVY